MTDADYGLTIRAAGLADLETIVDFNAGIALETEALQLDRERLKAGVAALLADSGKGQYFVAIHADDLVGQIMFTKEWSDWRNGDFWWIQSVYVAPDARGRGVFSRLYRHVEAAAHEQGARGLRLYVDNHNQQATRIYEKLGMKQSQYRMMEVDFVIPRSHK